MDKEPQSILIGSSANSDPQEDSEETKRYRSGSNYFTYLLRAISNMFCVLNQVINDSMFKGKEVKDSSFTALIFELMKVFTTIQKCTMLIVIIQDH